MKNSLLKMKSVLLVAFVIVAALLSTGDTYGQTTVFDQSFAGANIAPVSTSSTSTPATVTNADYYTSAAVASRFTNIAVGGGSGISININNVVAGEFNVADGANGNWILSRTADIASPAPTAVKVTFNAKFDVNSTGSAGRIFFQFGSGFSDTWNHGTVGAMKEADANVFAGIMFRSTNSSTGATIYQNNNSTQIGGAIAETYNTWTLVMNNTGASLSYTPPAGGSPVTVADNKFDLYLGTTLLGDELPAPGTSASLTDFKFATYSNSSAGRINFFLQDFKVEDISPVSCSTPTLSGAAQAATVCAGSAATINLTGLIAGVTNNAIDYTINGVAQTQVTGVTADGSGNASFTSAALTAGNDGQILQITKITKQTCIGNFTQNVTLSVNAPSNGGTTTYNGAAVCAGSLPSGTITVAGIVGTVTKWQKSPVSNFASGVVDIANTSTTLTAAEVGAVSVNTYIRAVVTNGVCAAANTASPSLITVNALPSISGQSTASANYPQGFGSPAALSVTASGAGVQYQWYSSTDNVTNTTGDDIALGTSNSETPSTATLGTLYYYCVVSGTCLPSVTSNISGAINILPACTAPVFSVSPVNQTECVGGTATLGTVVADQSPTYQWYSNTSLSNTGGTSVGSSNGGNTDTYTPSSITPGNSYYYCIATSGACSTASVAVQLTVNATAIASQSTPAASYSLNGSATALTVTPAAYTSVISYQWYSSTDAATNTAGDDNTVGTNSASYTPLTTSLGTLYYYCVVTGTCTPSTATSAISGAISVVQYTTGDYVSAATGNWAINTTWNKWNGTALVPAASGDFPNTTNTTASVYIVGGNVVTYNVNNEQCLNLYVLNGQLLQGVPSSTGSADQRKYLKVFGNTIQVNTGGTLGSIQTGNNADGLSLDLFNTGTVTLTGTGGLINISTLRYNNTTEVVIDHDVTLNYHGSSNGGNAMSYCGNVASPTNDNTLTVNQNKTLTFAPWSCYSARTGSGTNATINLVVNVNGTLTMQPWAVPYTAPKGYMAGGVGAGKFFYLGVGATGVVNLQEFWPNGINGNGELVYVEIASGGVVNVANITDLRNVNNLIYGDGEFKVQAGATLRIGDLAGISQAPAASGAVQTGVRTFGTGANYSYEGTAAQVTGDGLPAAVNNLTFNNAAGVTLTNSVSAAGALTLTSGVLTTGANTVTALTSVARTSGRVNGKLERAVASGASTVDFAIGDAANYTPVSLTFGAGNTAGNVTASTAVPNAAPAAGNVPAGSGISQTKYINRNWTLTTTIPSPNYTATFTYINPADVVGGANTSALVVGKNNGGVWANATGTSAAPAATTAAGLTTFGTFSLGETNCIAPSGLTYTSNTITYCANSAITTNSPSFTGDAATSYSVSPALPTGLTLNTSTGDITGIPTVAAAAANYTVTVNNACGSTTKDVNITVNAVTAITVAAAPVSQTKFINSAATNITVGATGASLTYQWFSNTSNSNVGGTSVGAANGGQTNTYTPATNTLGTTYYYCEITGACGSATSAAVTVTITNTNTWAGGGTSDWSTGANWTSGLAPTGANDAVIPNGNTPYPVLSASSAINDLTIDAGATVSINGFTFTITGAVTGTGTLSGSATSGVTTSATTTLRFTPGANTLKNLNVNAGTTTLGNALDITAGTALNTYGTVTVANGATLASNGNLNIKSNQFGTARVAAGSTGGNYITGDVTVERYIPANSSKAWRLLSVPTKGTKTIKQTWQENQAPGANGLPGFGTQITANLATLAIIQAAGFDAFSQAGSAMSYNSGTQAWAYLTSTNSAPIETNKGYFLYIRGSRAVSPSNSAAPVDATVLRTTGTLYQGDNNTAISVAAGKFEPVGNTYASAVDFTNLSKTGTLTNSIYVWDSKLIVGNQLGAYQTFVGALGFTPTTNGGSYPAGVPNTTIESGQAIMVGAPAGGGGTIKLVEAAKTTGNQLNPFRPAAQPAQFRTSLYKAGSVFADNNIVVFDNAYSNAADANDAVKIAHGGENLDILTDNKSLVVDARQPVTETDVIHYSLKNLQAQSYKLSFTTLNMNTAGLTAFVEDKYLHTTTEIDLNSASEYSFTVDASNTASAAADRLSVVFKKAGTLPVSDTKPAITVSPNPVENSMMRLSFAKQAAGRYTISLLNTDGQVVFTNSVIHGGGNSAHIQNVPAALAAGTYRLEVIAPDKTRSGQSVFINKK